ncbi:MAG: Uma2 family endonuclease [Coprococcus sp.]
MSNDPLTVVQPDIMVVCDKDKLDGKDATAPDFIIEIVSPENPVDDLYGNYIIIRMPGSKNTDCRP